MSPSRTMRELLIALALFAFGLICLPALIYLVGQQVIGDYETGLTGFYEALAAALLGANPFAWLLMLSPYLAYLLIRASLWLRRQNRAVN